MVVGALPSNDHRGQAMRTSISLTHDERNTLLDYYRAPFHDPALRLRAHIILLLAGGHTWATIAAVLFCSTRTIDRWHTRFAQGRVEALLGQPCGRRPAPRPNASPTWSFTGSHRSRRRHLRLSAAVAGRAPCWSWSCGSAATWPSAARPSAVGCAMPISSGAGPGRSSRPTRPRPRGHPRAIAWALLRNLPEDETVVFEDEVDINLNPDIGCMWMRRGQQAEVVTPGDNVKKYLAGALHWRTGTLLAPVTGSRRNGALVVAHLEELCRRLRRYKVIHVIWDSPKFHLCKAVQKVVKAQEGRLVLHQLPKYAPECNPVERVWWHLREEITRNHRCRTIAELVDLVFRWLEGRERFVVEDKIYQEEALAECRGNAA